MRLSRGPSAGRSDPSGGHPAAPPAAWAAAEFPAGSAAPAPAPSSSSAAYAPRGAEGTAAAAYRRPDAFRPNRYTAGRRCSPGHLIRLRLQPKHGIAAHPPALGILQHGDQEGQLAVPAVGGKAEGVPLLPVGKAQGAAQRAHRPQLAQAP